MVSKTTAIIMVGGPMKGTRFRPISLELPKPLFPVGGKPMIWHHIAACALVPGLTNVVLMGYFEEDEFRGFIGKASNEFPHLNISYLFEGRSRDNYSGKGTIGGLYIWQEKLLSGGVDNLIVLHCDICTSFPLTEMLGFHSQQSNAICTVLGTNVTKETAKDYGNIVGDDNNQVVHYVGKPESFVSDTINCGVYVFNAQKIIQHLNSLIKNSESSMNSNGYLNLETDVLEYFANKEKLFLYIPDPSSSFFWRQIKSAGASIECAKLYMQKYRQQGSGIQNFADSNNGPEIVGNVIIDSTASVHSSCKIGPNVTIGPGCTIKKGVRIHNSIILDNGVIESHAMLQYCIIGNDSYINKWARVEGDPNSINNHQQGITLFGAGVSTAAGIVIRNCVVLPHKSIGSSTFNEVIL